MKSFLIVSTLTLLSFNVYSSCKVNITKVTPSCDGHGSYCLDFNYVNDEEKDYMACVWDKTAEKGKGFAICNFAERKYKESFENVLIGIPENPSIKDNLTAACLSEKESDALVSVN